MTFSPFSDENSQTQQLGRWEQTPSHPPTPGFFDRESTPSVFSLSSDHVPDAHSSPLRHRPSNQLGFRQVAKDGETRDEQSQAYINYLIEWKVTLNNRMVKRDTEQDLDLKPDSYWETIKENAENAVRRKIKRNQRVRPDDTEITVSVNDRSQQKLIKNFDSTDVDWAVIEKQLLAWENLSRLPGKRLKLCISINYIMDNDLLPSAGSDKRAKTSVTRRMISERDIQIDAEHASGQQMVWREVYKPMRCPGPPCRHDGQYCWQDPVGKKHYKLRTTHLKSLVKFAECGGILETHDDVPEDIRQQLYAEEELRLERQKKGPNHSLAGTLCPPININVLPGQSPPLASTDATVSTAYVVPLDISGPLDIAVEEYTAWQISRVSRDTFRQEIAKAGDVALENCLDLKQIDRDQDSDFFVKQGVKVGAARRFVSEIRCWLGERQRSKGSESLN